MQISFKLKSKHCQIRHGQAVHNVAGEKDHAAYSFPEFFDAQLTPHGWDQVFILIIYA